MRALVPTIKHEDRRLNLNYQAVCSEIQCGEKDPLWPAPTPEPNNFRHRLVTRPSAGVLSGQSAPVATEAKFPYAERRRLMWTNLHWIDGTMAGEAILQSVRSSGHAEDAFCQLRPSTRADSAARAVSRVPFPLTAP